MGGHFAKLVALALLIGGEARAQSEPGVKMGRIPIVWLAPAGGFTFTSLNYQRSDAFLVDTPVITQESDSRITGNVGPEVRLRVDAQVLVIHADGFFNVIPDGDMMFQARGGVVFAAGLGGRSSMKLKEGMGSRVEGDYEVHTYRVHLNKETPLVYGLYLGASAFGMRAIEVDAKRPDLDASGDRIPRKLQRAAAVPLNVEAGFAVTGAQLELVVAPAFEVTTQKPGLRWAVQYGLPLGSLPFFGRFSGDHLFGSDLPITGALLLSIGIGSSMGVSTSD
jgi:hypothetical protein